MPCKLIQPVIRSSSSGLLSTNSSLVPGAVCHKSPGGLFCYHQTAFNRSATDVGWTSHALSFLTVTCQHTHMHIYMYIYVYIMTLPIFWALQNIYIHRYTNMFAIGKNLPDYLILYIKHSHIFTTSFPWLLWFGVAFVTKIFVFKNSQSRL